MSVIEVPFTSLICSIADNRGRTAPTADAGIPLIATNCIKDGALYPVFEKVRYVDQHTYDTWFRAHPKPGDIIFVCKGSPGRVALVPDPVDFCIAQDMVAIRADSSRVYPKYLFAILRSSLVRRRIDNMHVGTLIPHFKKGDFGNLLIPVVDDDLQRDIGDAYFDLSCKIESSRRETALLLQLIRAFVVRALSRSREEIPVARLAAFVNGGAFTKGASGSGRMVLRIAELNSGPGAATVYSDAVVPDDQTARAGDILMSWSGSLSVYRWFRDEAIVNQHIFKVIPTSKYPAWLVFDRLEAVMSIFQGIAKDKATTMGHIQRGHLESTTVEVPDVDLLSELDAHVAPLWDRLLLADRQVVKLENLRDALLSEMLSSRIRMPSGAEDPAEVFA